jgi:hypothetical protein
MIPNTGLSRNVTFELPEEVMKDAKPIETGKQTKANGHCVPNANIS